MRETPLPAAAAPSPPSAPPADRRIFLARYFLRWPAVRRLEVRRYGFSSRAAEPAVGCKEKEMSANPSAAAAAAADNAKAAAQGEYVRQRWRRDGPTRHVGTHLGDWSVRPLVGDPPRHRRAHQRRLSRVGTGPLLQERAPLLLDQQHSGLKRRRRVGEARGDLAAAFRHHKAALERGQPRRLPHLSQGDVEQQQHLNRVHRLRCQRARVVRIHEHRHRHSHRLRRDLSHDHSGRPLRPTLLPARPRARAGLQPADPRPARDEAARAREAARLDESST
mmetsp:Transcript_2004/g.6653  ORF Transcript_2004/g.6653 Transcript_2004/m.6653 type:complete len:278 (-) Transcript_2004:441-1274(-)